MCYKSEKQGAEVIKVQSQLHKKHRIMLESFKSAAKIERPRLTSMLGSLEFPNRILNKAKNASKWKKLEKVQVCERQREH